MRDLHELLQLPFGPLAGPMALECQETTVTVKSGTHEATIENLLARSWSGEATLKLSEWVRDHWYTIAPESLDEVVPIGIEALPGAAADILASTEDKLNCWLALVRITSTIVEGDGVEAPDDPRTTLTHPLFLRLWFLLLSMPFRSPEFASLNPIDLAFGDGRYEYGYRARAARDLWANAILQNEQLPVLAVTADGPWIESEARTLVFSTTIPWATTDHLGKSQLSGSQALRALGAHTKSKPTLLRIEPISAAEPANDALASRDDEIRRKRSQTTSRLFMERFIREFFLRRLMIAEPWQTLRALTDKKGMQYFRWVIVTALIAVGLSPIAISQDWMPSFPQTPGLLGKLYYVVFFYLVAFGGIFYSVMRHGVLFSYPFCLRLLGSSFLGVFALATLGSAWRSSTTLWLAAAPLSVASLAFLALQAKSHGAAAIASMVRAFVVMAVGWCHAVGITVMALAFGFPGFYASNLNKLGRVELAQLIVLGAAIALALGVFLQVLWEDRPATYPLGRLQWRSAQELG